MHHYGLDISKLHDLVRPVSPLESSYGSRTVLAATPDYHLERFIIKPGEKPLIEIPVGWEATLFVEEGSMRLNDSLLRPHMVTTFAASDSVFLVAIDLVTLYVFSGPAEMPNEPERLKIMPTADFRDKYWGNIQTMLNRAYTGKRLFFKQGKHSSLHFHCNKTETYFIHSGELLVRLRAGRGEDRSFTLHAGDTLFIPPGLMHQDGAIQDTVIIEVSTHDEDSDSFIIEDGSTVPMPGLPAS